MLVRDCMTKNVELADPWMSLSDAARKMRDGDFGSLPIGENDRLVGMITDRDIVVRALADDKNPWETRIRDIMSGPVLYCYDDQTLDEVAHNMGDNQVRRLPVLNRQKRIVGILSLGDLAQSRAAQDEVDEALSRISAPGDMKDLDRDLSVFDL